VRAAIPQSAHDLIGEAVFPDAVAETNQLVDIAEDAQRPQETLMVAMQIRDDAHLQDWPRQRIRFIGFKLITTSASWLSTSTRVRTMPRSGFERERLASRTVTRIRSTSPGRTGRTQRNSSMPGEPRLARLGRNRSTRSRIMMVAVCHPLAINPPKLPWAAASGSTCISCGS